MKSKKYIYPRSIMIIQELMTINKIPTMINELIQHSVHQFSAQILNSHEFTPHRVCDVMRVSCGCSLLHCFPAGAGNV